MPAPPEKRLLINIFTLGKDSDMVGVGTCRNRDSRAAGEAATRAAMENAGGMPPSWALAFSAGHLDPEAVLAGIRSVAGDIPVIGGAGIGTITSQELSYSGFECAVALFAWEFASPHVFVSESMEEDEREAGANLGRSLADACTNGETVLLFYDSVRSFPPPCLHVGSVLLDGIHDGLGGRDVKLVGAGLLGYPDFRGSHVFDGKGVTKHRAVAAMLCPAIRSKVKIMHGCIPVSSFLEITRIEGPIVYELDGLPALDVLRERIGSELEGNRLMLAVTLGEKQGDPFAPYREDAYVNRLIIGSNAGEGSITLFEADFEAGTKIQIMSRDNRLMLDSVRKGCDEILASLDGTASSFALYVDCAGRSCSMSGAEIEEAAIVQEKLGGVPLLGFYSGVEIAPLLGRSRPLDWTGVLTLLEADRTA
jgi:hypothetical protein